MGSFCHQEDNEQQEISDSPGAKIFHPYRLSIWRHWEACIFPNVYSRNPAFGLGFQHCAAPKGGVSNRSPSSMKVGYAFSARTDGAGFL
jgi:hypothetical protein